MNKYVRKILFTLASALMFFLTAVYLYTHDMPVQGHGATLVGVLLVYLAVDQYKSRLY
ncbi:MAG: hypothetical protein GF334_05680 [Candidatus Altiarchaeales archaeon]|nr:hypothetical protein [Candidatus Altiarchaeales archaeon]